MINIQVLEGILKYKDLVMKSLYTVKDVMLGWFPMFLSLYERNKENNYLDNEYPETINS